MIQLLRLLRETVLLAMYAPAADSGGHDGKRMPLRTRRRVEKRLTELRRALAAQMSQEEAHAQGEPGAATGSAPSPLPPQPPPAEPTAVVDRAARGRGAALPAG